MYIILIGLFYNSTIYLPMIFSEGMMVNVDSMFNLTATYEEDADIVLPYGFYYKRQKQLINYIPPNTNRYLVCQE